MSVIQPFHFKLPRWNWRRLLGHPERKDNTLFFGGPVDCKSFQHVHQNPEIGGTPVIPEAPLFLGGGFHLFAKVASITATQGDLMPGGGNPSFWHQST